MFKKQRERKKDCYNLLHFVDSVVNFNDERETERASERASERERERERQTDRQTDRQTETE